MIRHKAMFKVFFIITASCLGTLSEAGTPCIWCDNELLQRFMDCCTQRMASNPNFKTCSSSMEEMKTDLLEAAKGMKNNGPIKENAMKGAIGYSMADCISGADGNPDKKISDTKNILKRCYRAVNKNPDDAYIKEVIEIIKDKLEEKGNPSNVQQPKKETQSDEIPQAGRDTSRSQYNNSPPQLVEADTNQGKNQWNGPNANTFPISSANTNAIPYGTPQKPPALPYNTYMGNADQNQPFIPYNQQYNYQGNPSQYQFPYQNNPLNTINSNTGVSAASRSYASNEPLNQAGDNMPYVSSFASAASQTAYNYPTQNDDYNSNRPAFNTAAASRASSSVINDDGNNAASSSSGSYSIVNSNQKSSPFNNSKSKGKQKLRIPVYRPQTESIFPRPRNQQNKWDSNPNLNPVMPNNPITQPEFVKTSSVPQQTSPTATQNVAQANNWKINNQKNVPSTKDDEDDKYARALKLAQILHMGLINDESFNKCFHPFTTKEQLNAIVSYMLYYSLSSCGYDEETTQRLATNSISFMDGFPIGSATSNYAEAISKMVMVLFYRNNLIGDDPQGQAEALKNSMSAALKKIESTSPPQYNDAKPAVLPVPEQNLPQYPTETIPYDNDYPNYDAADPQAKPYSFSNKQINQRLDLLNRDSDYSLPQTLPIQKQKYQPNVYDVSDQPTDDKAISYDKSGNIKTKKKAYQSYADADDKLVYGSDDNDHDVFPGQWQNQKQKNQTNINDNNDQSPDDEPISYDKTIKNKSDKKSDQPYVGDKTVYNSYNDKNQPSNDKQNKKGNQPYFGSTGKDDDYSEGSYPYEYYDDNGTYVYDDGYYYDYPGKNDEDGDINPSYYLGYSEKEQSPSNDYNNNDKSKYKPKQQPDILIQKADSKTSKQGYNNPDTYNVPGDNSKKILISKTLEQQKDKSNPLYLPDYDKDGGQKPSKPLPPIADDQQNSKLPDIGQKNFSTAPIIPETLKNSDLALNPDKQTDLSTDAPVFQPDILDSSTNPGLNKTKNDESKARVEILKKLALDCMKGNTFDYNRYAGAIASLEKLVQQNHPDWSQQKSQTTVLIETIFALTQLLLLPNSQWKNQNVPQKNQNPNFQSGQANKNSQPVMQDKSAVDYVPLEQNIAYPSQNQDIQQNKWGSNQNPVVQNTLLPQSKPTNANYVTQPSAQNNWNVDNERLQNNDRQITNNKENSLQFQQPPPNLGQDIQQNKWGSNQNPVVQNALLPQSKPTNANYVTQPSAQNNWNVDNQRLQNNDRQITNNKENSLQFQQSPPNLEQFNTNQGNGKWRDQTFPFSQIMNPNAGVSNINNFQQPLDNQANLPGLQQKMNNPNFLQNRDQGRYAQSGAIASSGQSKNEVITGVRDNKPPTPNDLNNPSSVNGNQAPAESRANWSPMPNGLSSINLNQPFAGSQDNWPLEIANDPKKPILVPNRNQRLAEVPGIWSPIIPNSPINPSLGPIYPSPINPSYSNPMNNWAQSNPTSPQNRNQGNWKASRQNYFVNPGNPGIGGVNQAVDYPQRNQWNKR